MTISVSVLASEWTQVNVKLFGTIGNFNGRDVILQEQEAKPLSSVVDGHILRPGGDERFSLCGKNKLWARSLTANTKVLISTGIHSVLTNVELSLLLDSLIQNFNSNNEQVITQLKLLNLRIEETFDTRLNELDIEDI